MSALEIRARDGRQRIITAAYDLFSIRGFAAVSMQQIADASSVTKATLYHHFKDKDSLFEEIVRMTVDQTRENLRQATVGPTFRDQLISLADYIFSKDRKSVV